MLKMKLIASVMIVVLTTALIGGLTGAWFTSVDSAGTATFTAGTLTVDVSESLNNYVPVLSTPDNMEPGDVFDPITIEIVNDGSKDLAWFGNWTFTPLPYDDNTMGTKKLLDKLYIKTMSMSFLDSDGIKWTDDDWYSGYDFIKDGRGNDLGFNSGEAKFFNDLADLSPIHVITLRNWSNNSNMIPGSVFEHMGALIPGNKYVLKVEFAFHESADNDYQGNVAAPIEIGFDVTATQVNEAAINALNPGMGTTHINWMNAQIALQ